MSPLHPASVNGHFQGHRIAGPVQCGATIDLFNDKRETPLYHAVKSGKLAISRLLIDHGANLHTVDGNG